MWGRTQTTGMTLTLYLERSYSIERRKANRFSAPLRRRAASGEKQLMVRSIGTDPALHTAENGKEKKRGRRKVIMLEQRRGCY